jgi:hypothetical protein
MDANRVSACDGTATIALVCRIISPSGAPHLRCSDHLGSDIGYPYFEQLFSCAGRSLAVTSRRLDEYGRSIRSHPTVRKGRVVLMHGLDAYHLPERKPEVITSRAPATECVHARVARMRMLYESHRRTPASDGACVDPSCCVPNCLPQGRRMVRHQRSRFTAQVPLEPLGCVHA